MYNMICQRLKAIEEIKHIDLWNNNVSFIEQEEAWERPAVFVEFMPVSWSYMKGGMYRAQGSEVRLHIVTDWVGSAADGSAFKDDALESFDLSDKILPVLADMEGANFHGFNLRQTLTNHNHEDILENIDVYGFVATKELRL